MSIFRLTMLLLTMLMSVSVSAATANIEKIWLEHGLTINGRSAMKVHGKFNIKGAKGVSCAMNVWIKGPSGNWHRVNSSSRSTTGDPYFRTIFRPGYESTVYSDLDCPIYIDDLNLLNGKNTYTVIVTLQDGRGTRLAQSEGVTFTGTGSQNSYNNGNNNNSYSNSGNRNSNSDGVQTWREELGYGGFVIVKKFPNGYIMRTRYRPCVNCNGTKICGNCHGTGMCPICNGQGGIVSAGYGNYYPCYSCQSSGRCMFCHGNRACTTCTRSEYPGSVIASTSTIAPDGSITKDNVDYNNYDSSRDRSSSNSNSSRKSGCSYCGGTGVSKTANSGGSRSSWVAYYNSSGTQCPYCGSYTSHYHDRCSHCNVPSR